MSDASRSQAAHNGDPRVALQSIRSGWLGCVHQHPGIPLLREVGRALEGGRDWSPGVETYLDRISWLKVHLGFAVEEVHAGDPADCYAYTVGLTLFDDPELIVFGLPTAAALPLLTAAAFGAMGRNPGDSAGTAEVRGLHEDFPVAFHELPTPEQYLTVAHAMWEEWSPFGDKSPFRAVRLILDDEWQRDLGHGSATWDITVLPPPPADRS